jgi:hypothetical protein
VLAGVLLVQHPSATSPPPRPPDARLLAALGRWIGAVDPAPVLHSAHPFSYLQLPSVPEERFADFGRVRSETLQAAPPGTWVVVEDRFWTAACGNEGGGWPGANPGEADLKAMGYAPVAVPDLGVDMTHGDPRHDAATSTMSWALYRKTR